MRHRDPDVLVYLFWVGGRQACLCREGKFGNAVGPHLLWVGCGEGEWLGDEWSLGALACFLWLWDAFVSFGTWISLVLAPWSLQVLVGVTTQLCIRGKLHLCSSFLSSTCCCSSGRLSLSLLHLGRLLSSGLLVKFVIVMLCILTLAPLVNCMSLDVVQRQVWWLHARQPNIHDVHIDVKGAAVALLLGVVLVKLAWLLTSSEGHCRLGTCSAYICATTLWLVWICTFLWTASLMQSLLRKPRVLL